MCLRRCASTGLFDVPGLSVEVEHDPVTNQLRVLSRRSFGEIVGRYRRPFRASFCGHDRRHNLRNRPAEYDRRRMRPFSKRVFGVIAAAVAMTAAVLGQAGAALAARSRPRRAPRHRAAQHRARIAVRTYPGRDDRSEQHERLVRGDRVRRPVEDNQPRHHVQRRFSTTRVPSRSAVSSSIPSDSNVVWVGSGENPASEAPTSAMAFTSPPTPARAGSVSGLAIVGAHRQYPDRSAKLEHGVRGVAGAALVSRRRARALQDDGRRRTWTAVLTISPDTGVSDVVSAHEIPTPSYASSYQRRRGVGQMVGGGPEGGHLQVDECRQDLDEADERTAERRRRTRGARRRSAPSVGGFRAHQRQGAARPGRPAVPAPPRAPANPVDEAGFYRSDDAGELLDPYRPHGSSTCEALPGRCMPETRSSRRTRRASGIAAGEPRTTTSCSSTLIGRTRSTRSTPISTGAGRREDLEPRTAGKTPGCTSITTWWSSIPGQQSHPGWQ